MPLSFETIRSHPRFFSNLRQLAGRFIDVYSDRPRLASVFAAQQRWLMAHLAIAMYLDGPEASPEVGMNRSAFLGRCVETGIASRNTAQAFVQEMLKYGFALTLPGSDRRSRPLAVAPECLAAVDMWTMLHLDLLDALDQGNRLARYRAVPDGLRRLQPGIADGLLNSPRIRTPERTFSLFIWLNQGGLVMDRLIVGLEDHPDDAEQIRTSIVSTPEFAEMLKISRSHLARKLREAELLGSVGWTGERGRSTFWISRDFLDQYKSFQAAKLEIIDASFATRGL